MRFNLLSKNRNVRTAELVYHYMDSLTTEICTPEKRNYDLNRKLILHSAVVVSILIVLVMVLH